MHSVHEAAEAGTDKAMEKRYAGSQPADAKTNARIASLNPWLMTANETKLTGPPPPAFAE
jgi:hypothetical protein